ncbi:MAG: alpha/beta hydrolase [Cryomorphaceae bacterium]|nr:alpha/beta hydrolase [Cryomorphaceae bacterium]
MKNFWRFFSLVISSFLISISAYGQDFNGSWIGKLDVGTMEMRINIHISTSESGQLTGTFDSPDQGAFDLPFTSVTVTDDELTCINESMGITLTAAFIEDNDLEARWLQGGMAFPVSFQRAEGPIGREKKKQDPVPPFPYEESFLFVVNEDGDTIHGTLTLPHDVKKAPLVILITGSGPQNRDSEILGHRPFLVLADYLSRRGIAVFRYDERGVGESGGNFETATSRDFAADAGLIIRTVANHKRIDNRRIGVYGHSEGAMVAAILNAEFINPNFLILAAGPGVPIPELLKRQTDDILRMQGTVRSKREDINSLNSDIYNFLLSSETLEAASVKINNYFNKLIEKADDQNDKESLQRIMETKKSMRDNVMTPWFHFFIKFDPDHYYSQINIPTLIINGKKDLQVWWEDNPTAIKRLISASGNEQVEMKIYDNINHLFQTSETGAPMEYAGNEETFNVDIMADIATFIHAQKAGKKIK